MSRPSGPRWPAQRQLRVALLAPPFLPVPPPRYGGIERVIGLLADGLQRAGHDVTLFAPGDSEAQCRLIPTVERALWHDDEEPATERLAAVEAALAMALERARDFDVIHSHLETIGVAHAARSPVPLLTTLHGPTDGETAAVLARHRRAPLVAISESQRAGFAGANWVATIHNAIEPPTASGDGAGGYLCFLGRIAHDKGIVEALELARRSGRRLVIGAKASEPAERQLFAQHVAPAIRDGVAEYVGEVDGRARDRLLADALATVMLHNWSEPFGLVAAESLAVGTPVIARPAGALAELVRPGIDGFLVADVDEALVALERVGELDRAVIAANADGRFSAGRMVGQYVDVYRRLASEAEASGQRPAAPSKLARLDEVASQNV